MPPSLRWAFSRLPLRSEERVRLEREAFDATGFVTHIERVLVAADDSANGKVARHLAGRLAQSRGIPMTVIALHAESAAPEAAVTAEAHKGYDLLIIGVERTTAAHGRFDERIARMAAGFEGPLAVAIARGVHLQNLPERRLNMLVPVRGNKVSRRGADVALALARAGSSAVTALYVLGTVGLGAAQRQLQRPTMNQPPETTILRDIVELANRYDMSIRTALRVAIAPEDAILRQARLGCHDLIVMGVGRPAGETLYFGKIAAAILENSQHSILFVSS